MSQQPPINMKKNTPRAFGKVVIPKGLAGPVSYDPYQGRTGEEATRYLDWSLENPEEARAQEQPLSDITNYMQPCNGEVLMVIQSDTLRNNLFMFAVIFGGGGILGDTRGIFSPQL